MSPLSHWGLTLLYLQICLLTSGAAFGIGIILLATAQDLAMVILGRILMGAGVGFAHSSSTLCKPCCLRVRCPCTPLWQGPIIH